MRLIQLHGMPRVRLGHLPTPLERLDRLTATLGGPEIWIKRDDCTGLATGGNKTRKLEYLVADARAKGCDTLVTVGKIQSNHARQTAAAAATVGMSCLLLLEELSTNSSDDYANNGNALLNRMLGATTEVFASGERTPEIVEARLNELEVSGHQPYFIPVGGSNAVGSLGYATCAIELRDQAAELTTEFEHLVLATGSGGTHAGTLVGLEAIGLQLPVLGFSVSDDAKTQTTKVAEVAGMCGDLMGGVVVPEEKIVIDDAFIGPGYGQPDERTFEAIELFARTEGILLDPVYTGKAAAGLIDRCRAGGIGSGERVLFLHTGGQAGAFAYQALL